MEALKLLQTALHGMLNPGLELLPQLLIFIILLVITYFVAKLFKIITRRILKQSKMHKTFIEVSQSCDEVVRLIKSALDDANIEIPFSYRTLSLSEELNIIYDEFGLGILYIQAKESLK